MNQPTECGFCHGKDIIWDEGFKQLPEFKTPLFVRRCDCKKCRNTVYMEIV